MYKIGLNGAGEFFSKRTLKKKTTKNHSPDCWSDGAGAIPCRKLCRSTSWMGLAGVPLAGVSLLLVGRPVCLGFGASGTAAGTLEFCGVDTAGAGAALV